MPSATANAIALLTAAFALLELSEQRPIVFFRGSSAQVDDATVGVLGAAADWAKRHPANIADSHFR